MDVLTAQSPHLFYTLKTSQLTRSLRFQWLKWLPEDLHDPNDFPYSLTIHEFLHPEF